MKQFFKALDKEGACFECICKAFAGVTIGKLKNGIYDGPVIRKLIKDQNVITSINELETKT